MSRSIFIALVALALVGCKHNRNFKKVSRNPDGTIEKVYISEFERFSEQGEFVFNVQYASFQKNEIESKGVCTVEDFLYEFNHFNWPEQLTEANIKKSASPTLAVRHNLTRYEMGITIVRSDTADYKFLIFFGKIHQMKSIEVLDEKTVELYISKFFDKDFKFLENLFVSI